MTNDSVYIGAIIGVFTGLMFMPSLPFFNLAYYGFRGNCLPELCRNDFVFYGFPLIGLIIIIGSAVLFLILTRGSNLND